MKTPSDVSANPTTALGLKKAHNNSYLSVHPQKEHEQEA